MALSFKTRRRLSIVILVLGLPVYILVAAGLLALFERPPFLVELAVYVVLGIAWALPFKGVFRGVGQQDPDAAASNGKDRGE